jgi:hypothetical protein
MRGLSHFSIYRNPSPEPKRAEEAHTLVPFLLKLEQFITLEDVEYGQDPPDFVFRHANKRIGVELADLVPKQFGEGGYARRVDHQRWKSATKENPQPRHEFEWGEFTLRESLAAFTDQLDRKIQKARKWSQAFPESWLLMHAASGSPFGGLVAAEGEAVSGREMEVEEYFAKITHALSSICQRPHPFHQVILFSGMVLLALQANAANPYAFPVPTSEVLARGAAASERFLDWRSTFRSITEHSTFPPQAQHETPPT